MKCLPKALVCLLVCSHGVFAAAPPLPLSSGALMLLRYSRGELNGELSRARTVQKPIRAGVRPGLKGADKRINSVEKDLTQTRNYPHGPNTTQSETSVAVSGRNVVVGYNDSAAFNTTARSMNGYSYSTDGGATWTDGGGTPSAPATYNIGDPALATNRAGVFYYACIVLDYSHGDSGRGVLGVCKSTDGGRTFGLPVEVNPESPPLKTPPGPAGEFTEALSDKPWLAVDNSGGPRDGWIYVAWNDYRATTYPSTLVTTTSQILMSHSSDGGVTWSAPVAASDVHTINEAFGGSVGTFVSGAAVSVGPDGAVYCAWEDSMPSTFTGSQRISRSDDGGTSFAFRNGYVAAVNAIGNANAGVVSGGIRVNEFPSMAVDRRNGAVYIAYPSAPTTFPGAPTDPRGADRSDAWLVRSTDRGLTWSQPLRLNDDRTLCDQFFPTVAVTDTGTVGAIWYDRRDDPYNQRLDVFGATSADGGRKFSAARKLTSAASPIPQTNPNFDPLIAANYMGDYIGLAAGASRFHAAWGDNRDLLNSPNYGPRPDPNIYYSGEL